MENQSTTKLSVNINKVALLRNARGSNFPDLSKVALDCERFGAEGITIHPRPDERHIRYQDARDLRGLVNTEFNIEGYPNEQFIQLIEEVKPDQVTLVPDAPDALTSDAGWDAIGKQAELTDIVARLQATGARVSMFMEPLQAQLDAAKATGTNRVEFYTGPYAHQYAADREAAVKAYRTASLHCRDIALGLNAGHDLNLDNLRFFASQMTDLLEVSIGHALIVDALYLGLENTIQMYRRELELNSF